MEQATPQPNIWQLCMRNGLITGLILFAFTVIFQYVLEMYANFWLILIPVFGIGMAIFFTHRDYKEANGGLMSYGKGIVLALLLGALTGLIAGLLTYGYSNFLDPSVIDAQTDAQIDLQVEMLEKFGAADEEIDKVLDSRDDVSDKLTNPLLVIGGGILNLAIFALIIGLVVTAFTKQNDPALEY